MAITYDGYFFIVLCLFTMSIAPLDRLISISSAPEKYADAKRLSELADAPYVVLLGAPGMGKSVAFQHFASQAGALCVPAFRFRRKHLSDAITVFIDALDEVPVHSAIEIANSLEDNPEVRWRVSCREQDWNEGGKLSRAFTEMLAPLNVAPVVAQLQPLSEEEAIAVLTAFGCSAPEVLLSTVHTLRSTPFVMSPLGLKFLMNVRPERLPSLTRFELYESGARHFASEHNLAKAEDRQGSELPPDGILDHAGRVFLTLLLAGKHGVQRTSPAADTLLSIHDLGLGPADLTTVLDTALFLKNGDDFLPFHRSIQEFLAARYLARLVTGSLGEARLHFERALALLVSVDGLPADGLKALYAWFTCYLVKEGALQQAQRLVQQDPETMLLHGDAATLPVHSRITVLKEVGARDPFFRWTPERWGPAQICTVGLVTPDLAPLVKELLGTETSLHRLSMLLEALSVGPALVCTAEACWSVAIRLSAEHWCREQAVAAWLHNASPSVPDIWARIDTLCMAVETQRGQLRSVAQLFCSIPGEQLSVGDVERVLACLKRLNAAFLSQITPQDRRTECAYAVSDIARHVATGLWRTLILDAPKRWRQKAGVGSLEHQFVSVLAIAALSGEGVTAAEFAHMMVATGLITGADSAFKRAAAEWLAARSIVEDVLHALLAIMDREIADSGSLARGFLALGLKSSEALVRLVLSAEAFIASVGVAYVGRQIGIWTLVHGEQVPVWLISLLREARGAAAEAALQHLHLQVKEQSELQAQQPESVEQWLVNQIPKWQRQLKAVAAGELVEALYWGAAVYCGSRPIAKFNESGTEGLQETFGGPLAQAIQEGLAGLWSRETHEDDSGVITAASASIYLVDRQCFSGKPVPRVLEVLSASLSMRNSLLKERLEASCIDQLNRSLIEDSTYLHQLAATWNTNWIALLYKLGERPARSAIHLWVVQTVLEQHEKLSGALLDGVLRMAELNVEPAEIIPLISNVLRHWSNQNGSTGGLITGSHVENRDRLRWAYFVVCLRPEEFSNDFVRALEAAEDLDIHQIIVDDYPRRGYWQTSASTLAVSRLLLQFLFKRTPLMQGHFDRMWPDTVKVLKAVSLSNEPSVETILLGLLADAKDTRWEGTLRHELELYRRDIRAKTQKFFSPTNLAKVLGGKGPINTQDLKALVLLVLDEIAEELQSSPLNLWQLFWDNNKPKIENVCRDVLAGKLRDKLSLFGSFEVAPEAASSGGTRADLLVSYGSFAVPIEAKRTNHSHLWYGHTGQLQTYTLLNSTGGHGIYVVFWFDGGLDMTSSPAGIKPKSPEALKAALEDMLPAPLAATTSVLVLDVSDASQAAKVRKNSEFDKAKAAKPSRRTRKLKDVAEPPKEK